jgi:O-antigen/teichoic acid export membrane protein
MTLLPEAGVGEEATIVQGSLWSRARAVFGKRLSYALADQVAYSLGNMVVAALLSRHCAQREVGIYFLTQRTLDLIIQLCNVFLWGPFAFNLPGTPRARKTLYTGSVFLHQVMCCGGAALLMWIASRWASAPSRGLYYGVFAPLVATSASILFREYTRRMYFAEIRMKEAFWTDLATVVLQIAGVEWLYRTHQLDVPNTLWMLCAGASIVSVWWLLREWRTLEFSLRESIADAKLNLHLGRWFLGSNMVFMVSSQCNPWILSGTLGGAAVAAYTVCEQIANIPRVALASMQNIMAPTLARAFVEGGKPQVKKIVRRFDKVLFAGSALFAVGVALFGPWAAKLIFSSKPVPANARVVLILLALNLVAYASTMAQSYGLTAIDKADRPFYANLCGLTMQIAVSIWLVHVFQVPGAAAAMLLASAVVLGVRQMFYTRDMRAEVATA